MNGFPTLHSESRNKVLSVTIDNPPLNLIDAAFVRDLRGLLDLLDDDADKRVVVFGSADAAGRCAPAGRGCTPPDGADAAGPGAPRARLYP